MALDQAIDLLFGKFRRNVCHVFKGQDCIEDSRGYDANSLKQAPLAYPEHVLVHNIEEGAHDTRND